MEKFLLFWWELKYFEKKSEFYRHVEDKRYYSSILIVHSKDEFAHVNLEKCTKMSLTVLTSCNRKKQNKTANHPNKHLENR